jgi:hypothetical protein
MVLMLVLGCGFGWLGTKVEQAREQRVAEEAIVKLGGFVHYGPASGDMLRTVVAGVGKLLGEDLSKDVTEIGFGARRSATWNWHISGN